MCPKQKQTNKQTNKQKQRKTKTYYSFQIRLHEYSFNWKKSCNFPVQVNSGVHNAHMLQGKVINLGIHCGNDQRGYHFQGCLMFKLLGQQTCEFNLNRSIICLESNIF